METIAVEVVGGIVTLLLTALIGYISYQASRRDAQQQKQMDDSFQNLNEKISQQQKLLEKAFDSIRGQVDDLYDKHQKDSDKLQLLEVKIAQDHYNKPELDRKLDAIEKSFKEGFDDLGKKFDNLSNHLLELLKK